MFEIHVEIYVCICVYVLYIFHYITYIYYIFFILKDTLKNDDSSPILVKHDRNFTEL